MRLNVPKYRCTPCNRYVRHRFVGISPHQRATESYCLVMFEANDGGSQRKLSTTHHIGAAAVERWCQSYVKQRLSERSGRSRPQALGIDEDFFSRRQGLRDQLKIMFRILHRETGTSTVPGKSAEMPQIDIC